MLLKKLKGTFNDRDEEGRPIAYKEGNTYEIDDIKAAQYLNFFPEHWEKGKPEKAFANIKSKDISVDIIIPTYENEALTVKCINSIKKNTEGTPYRIIWVDNGSKNVKKVSNALKGTNHIKEMLPNNLGFVGAINAGLKFSDAPLICFLNNDTIVTPNWLKKLVKALVNNDQLGIVGPLTGPGTNETTMDSQHSITNMYKFTRLPYFNNKYTGPNRYVAKTYVEYNKELEKMNSGVVSNRVDFVAFLCSVMKREVLEAVTASDESYKDGLDPNFEMGLWDDVDYNRAIKKVGFEIGLATDTCIYHRGRSTFDVIEKEEGFDVTGLLAKNYAYLQEKNQRV